MAWLEPRYDLNSKGGDVSVGDCVAMLVRDRENDRMRLQHGSNMCE